MAQLLKGDVVAAKIRQEVKEAVAGMRKKPCLAVFLCTDEPASKIYVKKKCEACEEVGIQGLLETPFAKHGIDHYPDPTLRLRNSVDFISHEVGIHGVLVQLPLPKVIDKSIVLEQILPWKDVDVLTSENVGRLLQGRPRFVPCTPQGIHLLLKHYGITWSGKRVAIINRSDIVGKPLHALICQNSNEANATVTLCHDHTPPEVLKEICLTSDIIVTAVGKPKFLKADMVKRNVVVVDVGITRLENNKVVGDADFEAVAEKASWISPVPGGVGPLTVACLLRNTLQAKLEEDTDHG